MLDRELAPGRTWQVELGNEERGFLVVISGEVVVEGVPVPSGHVGVLGSTGTRVAITAGTAGARCTRFAGRRLSQPKVFGGPVVGGTREEVQAYLQAASRGAFGVLTPLG